MKRLFSLIVISLILQSCVISQDKVESEKTAGSANSKYIKEVLMKEGYELGTVKILKDSECRFVILNEGTTVYFDPINFNISDFEAFRQEDLKIYFKYKPLRMMNRCSEASPVELISIVKRED